MKQTSILRVAQARRDHQTPGTTFVSKADGYHEIVRWPNLLAQFFAANYLARSLQ